MLNPDNWSKSPLNLFHPFKLKMHFMPCRCLSFRGWLQLQFFTSYLTPLRVFTSSRATISHMHPLCSTFFLFSFDSCLCQVIASRTIHLYIFAPLNPKRDAFYHHIADYYITLVIRPLQSPLFFVQLKSSFYIFPRSL